MRAAEAARWKEQLAKAHAEAEAARKRGAELGEPCKAALEQKKQISAEMRALPHTQQLVRHGRMSILDRRERLEYERVTLPPPPRYDEAAHLLDLGPPLAKSC